MRTRNKPVKEFDKVFLAQELSNPISGENNEANLTSGAIWAMEFSKDGKFLATGGQDTVVRVWAVISSDEEREHFLEGSGTSVYENVSGTKLRAPVFRDKPLYEYRGHTADVLDLSWSKVVKTFKYNLTPLHYNIVSKKKFSLFFLEQFFAFVVYG